VDAQILRKEKGKKKRLSKPSRTLQQQQRGSENKKFLWGIHESNHLLCTETREKEGGRDRGAAVKYKNSRLAITHDLEE